MLEFLSSVLAPLRVFLRSRCDTALEVLALRQQVAVLKRQRPRPTVTRLDRIFWTTFSTAPNVLSVSAQWDPSGPDFTSRIRWCSSARRLSRTIAALCFART